MYGTNQYDDGVYVGASMRLVHGVIPYRDFVVVHPPGIFVLLAPIAYLGNFFGTYVSLALARDLTALVATVNVILVAAVLRHRDRSTCLIGSTAMACFPMAAAATSTVFLEPYLVFFTLLGLAVMLSKGDVASSRRVAIGGALVGFACSIKLFAAFIAVAACVVLIRSARSQVRPFVAGAAVGIGVPCLPFFVLAPGAFLHDILSDQLSRAAAGGARVSWIVRLIRFTGMEGLTLFRPTTAGVSLVVAVFLLLVAVALRRSRARLLLADWLVVVASAAVIVEFWLPHEMYSHYVYFSAPFLAMLLAIVLAEGATHLRLFGLHESPYRRGVFTLVGCVTAAAFLIPQQAGYARSNLRATKNPTMLNLFLAPDSCIITDNVELLISSGLFQPRQTKCPPMTDSFGTWLADGPTQEPAYSGTPRFGTLPRGPFAPSFVDEWARWLDHSDDALTMSQYSGYIPWTPPLTSWFDANFKVIYRSTGLWIYKHVGHAPPPAMQ